MEFTDKNQRILVTSALPYVNNVPHLGNLVCVLSADVFARYLKLKNMNILSILGTDEHGTTTETKALSEGLTAQQLCDKYYTIHKKVYEWFGCKFDCFGRTSSMNNHEITKNIFTKLNKNGFIVEQVMEMTFCEKCQKFLADRFVEGVCPHCQYPDARGDQCDGCSKLLNAVELINPKCKICDATPIIKKTNHLFIDLPKIEPELKEWIAKEEHKWSQNSVTMTHAWIKEGLRPRCITRDLKWGIPIPLEKFKEKVFYSWFDAPIGYISITADCRDDWKDWWLNKKTRLVQFMGKDNIPFHTILFPSFLMGTRDPYTILSDLSVNEYLNYENGKFSKSRGVGVFGDGAMESGIPSDIWRYYLMINRPENADTEFGWKDFQEKNNNELLANIGNFVNRTLTFVKNNFDSKLNNCEPNNSDIKFIEEVDTNIQNILTQMNNIKLKDSLKLIMHISRMGNQYFQENQPWALVKEDTKENKERCETVLCICTNLVHTLGTLIKPFLPDTNKKILEMLNSKEKEVKESMFAELQKEYSINKPEVLFKKIEDEEIQELREKFGGQKKAETIKEPKKNQKQTTTDLKEFPLNLKVAKIESVEDHPEADKLYVLQINLGSEKRQLVAGVKKNYKKEELLGRNIIVVCNLKPAKLRGVISNGMLLAAEDKKNVALLEVPNSNPGDAVFVQDTKTNAPDQIKFDAFLKIELIVDENSNIRVANFDNKLLKTDKELVTVKDIDSGSKVC